MTSDQRMDLNISTNGFEHFQLSKVWHTAYVRENHCHGVPLMPQMQTALGD